MTPTLAGIPAPAEWQITQPITFNTYLVDGQLKTWTGDVRKSFAAPSAETAKGFEPPLLGTSASVSVEVAKSAVAAAKKAFDGGDGAWPQMTPEQRIEVVKEFLSELANYRNEVIKLLMWEIGKNLADSTKEFDRTVEYILQTCQTLAAQAQAERSAKKVDAVVARVSRLPLGVVLCMGPSNYPFNETFCALIPALLMGNTAIIKPPHIGVLLYQPIIKAFQKTFPPGVVNFVAGRGRDIITPLMQSGDIDVFAFIGATDTAKDIVKLHPAPHRLTLVLGLGAKNPGIVMADADLGVAVKECIAGTLSYNGQRCTAIKVIYAHESIAQQFVAKLSTEVEGMKLGLPWEAGVKITPLPELERVAYMQELVKDATSKGAKVTNKGGGAARGTFYTPAVLYPVTKDMKVYTEEQFGPVVAVVPFKDIEEVMTATKNSAFGQQVSLFTSSLETVRKLEKRLAIRTARVNINGQCQRGPDVLPFTARKDSGIGTLSVDEALKAFSVGSVVAAPASDSLAGSL